MSMKSGQSSMYAQQATKDTNPHGETYSLIRLRGFAMRRLFNRRFATILDD